MISKQFTSTSSGSRKSTKNRSRSATLFIPSLKQLNDASSELPDPDLWPNKSYQCPIEVKGKQQTIEFSLKSIKRGNSQAARWIYEGRVLIRKRDI